MADIPSKRCRSCQQDLPHSEFYARPANRDGLYSYCRSCNTQKAREARQRSPEAVERKREYDRKRSVRLRADYIRRAKAHYAANRERRIAEIAEWSKNNPDRRRAIAQSYKHRRRTVERCGMTGREYSEWVRAQNKICYWCGGNCADRFHVDHYIPLSKGGKHEASNLVISCAPCNLRKSAKDPLVFAKEIGRLF